LQNLALLSVLLIGLLLLLLLLLLFVTCVLPRLQSHCWVPGGDYNKAVSKGDLINCVLLR
jgi:hypothetical protein